MIFFDVDTQHDFMDPGGALYVPDAAVIRENIESLLRAASRYGITTISTRCAHEPGDPEFDMFPPHCIDGTFGAERIFPGLPTLSRMVIGVEESEKYPAKIEPAMHYEVKKKVFDPFSNGWLDGLRRRGEFDGIDCVVFGVATDYCVRDCVLGVASTGAEVILVEDAVRGVASETTAKAVSMMSAAGVKFMMTEGVLKNFKFQI